MNNLTAVVMAAGLGTRLKDITIDTPKPLVEIEGKPLIEYGIRFLHSLGADRIIIVGGFQIDKLRSVVKDIDANVEVVENKKFRLGNIFSLQCGLDLVDTSCVVYHADHIFRKEIADKMAKQLGNKFLIFTDNDRKLTDDDMKVKTSDSGDKLKFVSKTLQDYSLGYVGITYCPEQYLPLYKQTIKDVIAKDFEQAVSEHVMQKIVDTDHVGFYIGDISGYEWLEIDTQEDLIHAREVMKNDFHYIINFVCQFLNIVLR